ncbi:hypothetical protein [Shouchella clausii]|uniref:hypothetical protein n=1 Tax=Shouchella clausii TaxID=79880 RepID=UPI000BA71C99|nr:hypothetical protein [Shouchella clausii]MBU8598306.1 hypothetical protein [Shouchella clausii]MCY1105168.1 hypothetical protein [Shouchella clausii]MEB5481851.1 hypothetical protein [Shouchella clausii]PAD07685.1 hypothetical protein CHH76_18590 [Shouchella clausii]PAD12670.1 hypothetical protein CHH74_14410 [Shouchella clausii]
MFKKKLVVSLGVSLIAAASFVVFTNTQANSEMNSRDKGDITFIDSSDQGDITSIDDRDKGDITSIGDHDKGDITSIGDHDKGDITFIHTAKPKA